MQRHPLTATASPHFLYSLMMLGLFLLPGCFGGEDTPADSSEIVSIPFYRMVQSEALGFMIQVPEDWESIQNFSSDYPSNTLVALRNNNEDHSFIANVNIVKNTVVEGTASSDYSLAMIESLERQLLNYKQHSQEAFALWIGTTEVSTYLTEFEGTNEGKKPTRQFIQLYAVRGTEAFIVTGTYDAADTELAIDQVKQTVKSFRLN